MTDYKDSNTLKHNPDSNMRALKNAIFNSEGEKLKMLLTNLVFDEIQKGYLINLAKDIGNSEIVELLKGSPATP
jgi:hypothetical protein